MVTLNGFISLIAKSMLTMQMECIISFPYQQKLRELATVLRLSTLHILSNSSKIRYEGRFLKYSVSFRLKYSEWGTVRLLLRSIFQFRSISAGLDSQWETECLIMGHVHLSLSPK